MYTYSTRIVTATVSKLSVCPVPRPHTTYALYELLVLFCCEILCLSASSSEVRIAHSSKIHCYHHRSDKANSPLRFLLTAVLTAHSIERNNGSI